MGAFEDKLIMLARAKLMFDLNGYIVIRGLLSSEEVSHALNEIKKHEDCFVERKDNLRNTNSACDSQLVGDGSTGRYDMGGMLSWKEDSRIFRKLLAHQGLVPYLKMLLGDGFRLDHSPLIIRQKHESEGFTLHGGPVSKNGMARGLHYQCINNDIHNSLVAVSFQLTDHNEGDGGFCVVKGSHKLNFPLTDEMMNGADSDFFEQCVYQPVTKAGDCVIFSEATIHGCLAWKRKDIERTVALYRFAPATSAYARGYTQWPKEYLDEMTEEQLAVMQSPYHCRFDRPSFNDDGSLGTAISRSQEKKDFDKKVFGETYF